MSKLVQSYQSHVSAQTAKGPQFQAFEDEWPGVAEAMRGIQNPSDPAMLWPCTVMLFWEGDQLKFCLSPKSGSRVCFGTVSDASKGLSGVETAIQEGHFEWKARGSRKFS